MTDNNLKKLQKLFAVLDEETLTRKEFVNAFAEVIDLMKKIEAKYEEKMATLESSYKQTVNQTSDKLITENNAEFFKLKNDIKKSLDKLFDEQTAGMNLMRDKLRGLRDGKDADEQKIIDSVLVKIKLPEAKELILDTPEQLRDKLETLNGQDKLRIEAINGLEEVLEELKNRRTGGGGGGFNYLAMDIHIIDDETPSGTKNGVNTAFTINNTPNPTTSLKVYLNGQRLALTTDYTFSGRTITFITAPLSTDTIKVDYRI